MWYNVHTHQSSNQNQITEIVNQYPLQIIHTEKPFSIGIHPFHANLNSLQNELEIMESQIQHNNCWAIGECGLDKKNNWDAKVQQTVFIEQVKLAEKYNKPVILHCISAYQEIIQLKKDLKIQVPLIIHGFAKSSLQLAQELIQKDFYLSFGQHLLKSEGLAHVFKNIPLNSCFLETDSMPNGTIQDIYKKAQAIHGLEVNKVIANNFKQVFNK
ncbi:TatD family hydrolase [Flavobacterium agricola]|uniref:TatD family hydrolase n=1 Tax=Flavobacterium agricola TaxID=2870839 RepID=A0ABY6M3P1_9FLAO|nr:TatD family hydrolase [Flavobacterium agricola]UYW02490.1 TatD family hydrolase [Flavobacterium agricola]